MAEPTKVFSQVLVAVQMLSLLKFGSDYYSENGKSGYSLATGQLLLHTLGLTSNQITVGTALCGQVDEYATYLEESFLQVRVGGSNPVSAKIYIWEES